MTIIEILGRIDSLKHNTYTQVDKISWLSDLDGKVKSMVIDTHEGGEDIPFTGYTSQTPLGTSLLVPAPYDDIYLRWLEAQINYHNGETQQYNEAITMFNNAWTRFENWYNRTHMPIGHSIKYF